MHDGDIWRPTSTAPTALDRRWLTPALRDAVEEEHAASNVRNDRQQSALADSEWQAPEILDIQHNQIEQVKVRPRPMKQQTLEIRDAVWINIANFAVETALWP